MKKRVRVPFIRWNGSFQRKSFILILLIASVPGLITGLGIYWFVIQNVETELQTLHEGQIEQRVKNMDEQLSYIEYSTARWAFDPRFGEGLRDVDFVQDFQETYDITSTLLLLQTNHALVKDVSLYTNIKEPVLFNSEYDVLDKTNSAFYEQQLEKGKSIQWVTLPDARGTLALMQNIPAASAHPFGSLIVTVDPAKARELMKTLTPYEKGATFLASSDGEILLSSNSTGQDKFVSALQKAVQENGSGERSFLFEEGEQAYSVSFGHFRRINDSWLYVSAAPMSSITAPLLFVSRLIIGVSAAALLLAIVLAWFASRTLSSPVQRLVRTLFGEPLPGDAFSLIEERWTDLSEQSEALKNRLAAQTDDMKMSFGIQLLQGTFYHYKEEDLRERMEGYGWRLAHRHFTAVDIQLTGFADQNTRLTAQEESLLVFALTNMMEELAKPRFDSFLVMRFSDFSAGMLLIHEPAANERIKLMAFADEVTKAAEQLIKMHATVTISPPANAVKHIPQLFEEARMGSRLRTVDECPQVIDLMTIPKEAAAKEVHYPFQVEKEIVQALRIGESAEIQLLIHRFLEELSSKSASELHMQQGVMQLYSSVQHEILYAGIHPHELFNGRSMMEELSQLRGFVQMEAWFMDDVITPYINQMNSRLNVEMKRLVESVMVKMKQSFSTDLSLESCADEAGTTPYALSKAFKQVAGINFIDYLTSLRIERAKELLLTTNKKISDIAEEVGYRDSYFNRIFKKQIGIPPGQFRKQRDKSYPDDQTV